MDVKIMIAGCSGQVGRCLVHDALLAGFHVLAFDRSQLDITDRIAVERKLEEYMPAIVINAAAYTAVDAAEKEPDCAYKINRDGPRNLAIAAQRYGAVLIHISTDYVFSGEKTGLYSEDDLMDPQCVYGASKLAGELAVIEECERYIIMRTAWVFGQHGNNFVKTMLRLLTQKKALKIVADQFGGPTFSGDISSALLTMAKQSLSPEFERWGVYHFSGMPYVSWHAFASHVICEAVAQGLFVGVPSVDAITTSEYPTLANRPANSCLDCSKIYAAFGIKPSDWQAALTDLRPYLPA